LIHQFLQNFLSSSTLKISLSIVLLPICYLATTNCITLFIRRRCCSAHHPCLLIPSLARLRRHLQNKFQSDRNACTFIFIFDFFPISNFHSQLAGCRCCLLAMLSLYVVIYTREAISYHPEKATKAITTTTRLQCQKPNMCRRANSKRKIHAAQPHGSSAKGSKP
jgi:hypothetical protein